MLLPLLMLVDTIKASPTIHMNRYRRTQQDPFICFLSLNALMYSDDTQEEFYSCSLLRNDDFLEGTYRINPPSHVLSGGRKEMLSQGQEVYLEIQSAIITEDEIILPSLSNLQVEGEESLAMDSNVRIIGRTRHNNNNSRHERRLQERIQRRRQLIANRPSSTGSFTAVLIRISTNDAEPTLSAETLYNYMFTASPSVKSQFEACSAGRLTVNADPIFRVIDIRLDQTSVENKSNKALMNLAETALNDKYQNDPQYLNGVSIRDYTNALMFVVPPGTGTWAAFATVAGKNVRISITIHGLDAILANSIYNQHENGRGMRVMAIGCCRSCVLCFCLLISPFLSSPVRVQ